MLDGDLQAAQRHGSCRWEPADAGSDAGAAEGLLPGPEGIGCGGGTNEDGAFERHAPSGKGRGIKLAFAVDHGEKCRFSCTESVRRRQEGERQASLGRLRDPFGEATGFEAALGEELIESGNSRGTDLVRRGTAGGSALQFLGEGRECGKWVRHARQCTHEHVRCKIDFWAWVNCQFVWNDQAAVARARGKSVFRNTLTSAVNRWKKGQGFQECKSAPKRECFAPPDLCVSGCVRGKSAGGWMFGRRSK